MGLFSGWYRLSGTKRSNCSPESDGQERVSKRLKDSLEDDTMTDLALVGDDDVPVPAVRYILGSASPVLKSMLYGDCKEAEDIKVTIEGYNSKLLMKLVDFCCSGGFDAPAATDEESISVLVAMGELGHKYKVDGLQDAVANLLHDILIERPTAASYIFQLASTDIHPDIVSRALMIMNENPKATLDNEIGRFGPLKLIDFFQSVDQIEVDPLYLFKSLLAWKELNEQEYDDIHCVCKEAAKSIKLASIDPSELKAVVMESGIVDEKQITETFMEQAILAKKHGVDYSGPVKSVKITDPSCPFFDGIYEYVKKKSSGKFRGNAILYERTSESGSVFTLSRSCWGGAWSLSGFGTRYYSCPHLEHFPKRVPTRGWTGVSAKSGQHPPTVVYVH